MNPFSKGGNSTFAIDGDLYFLDSFVVAKSFVLRISTCLPAGRFVVKIATFAKPETIFIWMKIICNTSENTNFNLSKII